MNFNNEYDQPFQVGLPVSSNNFKGRTEILNDILTPLSHISKNHQEHFFITGPRGIGKTSLSRFIADYVELEYNILTIHIENNGVETVEELLNKIITSLLKKAKKESTTLKLKKYIEENVTTIGLWSTEIKINENSSILTDVKNHFPYTIQELFYEIKNKNGLLIIIDDINGLSDNELFPNWYKSMVDTIAVDNEIDMPISFILTGYSEKFGKLHRLNPSFSRIFQRKQLEKLNDTDVEIFFNDIFNKMNITIEKEALDLMVKYTNGLPLIMQQIGLSIYNKLNISNTISKEIAIRGIESAGDSIWINQISSNYEGYEESKYYLSIFNKVLLFNEYKFTKDNLENIITSKEKEILDKFLDISINLNILRKKENTFIIKNDIVKSYINMRNLED